MQPSRQLLQPTGRRRLEPLPLQPASRSNELLPHNCRKRQPAANAIWDL